MSSQRQAILLAIGGGISAYKSAMVCSRLAQDGYDLRVAMTEAATKFIGPPTLSALSGKPVATNLFSSASSPLGAHIELTQDLDLLIVAPATANLLAKFGHGMADDLVSTIFLQAECPVLLAPAMSSSMWAKPAVQRNVSQLSQDGCQFVGPASGWLSCRKRGDGRMSEPDDIVAKAKEILS